MVSRGYSSIRAESAELNLSKEGATPLFVDQSAYAADDDNDGGSWTKPKLTIGGALNDSVEWTKIYVKPGTYNERLGLAHQNIRIIGVARDGIDRVEIAPTTGTPVTVTAAGCCLTGMALVAKDDHALKANGAHDLLLDNIYAEVNSSKYTIWLNDSDRSELNNCFINGKSFDSSIGILVGDGTVDAWIHRSYITGCGSGGLDTSKVGYGIATHANAQRALIEENEFVNNFIGCYLYGSDTYRGVNVIHNQFFENSHYDVYDELATSQNAIRNNLYGYVGWMTDNNHDGITEQVVSCHGSSDYAPLGGAALWKCDHVART